VIKFLQATAILLLGTLGINARAGITTITIGDTAQVAGENWPMGSEWYIRAILIDSSGNPIGKLSAETNFNTVSAGSVPSLVTVHLDASAPATSSILVYRSVNPIVAGSNVAPAKYDGLCEPDGCPIGDISVPANGQLRNSDFHGDSTAMPVKLQEFLVD
jgi:hypothetical protein